MRSKLLLSFLSISLFSFSQDSVFHIKDYKYRTTGYQALALNINFSGSYNSTDQNDVHVSHSNVTSLGPVYADYFRIRSTEKRFQQTLISLGTQYRSNSQKDRQTKEALNRFDNAASWMVQTRDYKANQWFLEWGNELRGKFGTNKIQNANDLSRHTDKTASNTFTIGFGKGRIEWVQDAQMASFILNDLASQNLLNRTPTAEESNSFTQLVTDINNRRIFDSRRRRIYELSRIDSFLKNTGLATQTDIRHFTTVNDNWAFSINPVRRSGAAWVVRLKPGVSIYRNESTYKRQQPSYIEETRFSFYAIPEIFYEHYKPISLKWQRNFHVSASYNANRLHIKTKDVRSSGETDSKGDYYSRSFHLSTSLGIGYFPNTRTQLTADFNLQSEHFTNYWSVSPSLILSAKYFIGYRTYLNADVTTGYTATQFGGWIDTRHNNFYGNFALRLSHFLF